MRLAGLSVVLVVNFFFLRRYAEIEVSICGRRLILELPMRKRLLPVSRESIKVLFLKLSVPIIGKDASQTKKVVVNSPGKKFNDKVTVCVTVESAPPLKPRTRNLSSISLQVYCDAMAGGSMEISAAESITKEMGLSHPSANAVA